MKSLRAITTRTSSPRQALFAGILTLMLVACSQAAPAGAGSTGAAGATAGSGPGGGSGSIPKDVCALLSAGELQSATGIAFDAGKTVAVSGGLGCEWDATGGLVSVDIFGLDHAQFVFNRDHLQGKPVAGVGDEAWTGGPGPAVFAAKGGLEIDVQVAAPGMKNDVAAAETALARLVSGRL